MTRQRSTWSKPGSEAAPRQAATSRRADVYTMNQEHPQPSVVEYENGDPDSWAETPTTNKNVEEDYEGDHVRRNEVGFGEFRKDTFEHKDSKEWNGGGKYDNSRQAAVARKSSYALQLSRELLRTDDQSALVDQATELMALPARTIASTLKRLSALSPDALPKERRLRRAIACCKLASRMIGDGATGEQVERLGHVVMSMDDPTLKTMIKMVAAFSATNKVAAEDDDKPQEQQSGEKKDDKPQEQQAQADKGQQPQEQQAQAPQAPQAQQEQGCLTADDMQALDQMLAEETGCAPASPAIAPPAAAPELTTIFAPPAPAPAMASAPAPVASGAPDIGFDEEDDETRIASDSEELTSLFDDHPEVQAQREIRASETQVLAAQGGYAPSAIARTASSSAKRIGHVQAEPPRPRSEDADLANLWDRPAV